MGACWLLTRGQHVRSIRERLEDKERTTGKTSGLLRWSRNVDRIELRQQQPWLEELVLDGRTLTSKDGEHDLTGATARVETASELCNRITGTWLVTLGVLALPGRKKSDTRSPLWLSIEGPNVAVVREYPRTKRLDERALRQFAAAVNQAAGTS